MGVNLTTVPMTPVLAGFVLPKPYMNKREYGQ